VTRLYAVTGTAFARVTRDDGGWSVAPALHGSGAQCLAVDPERPERVYVGCRGRGLWRSDDAGSTWRDLELPERDVFSVAVSAADGAIFAGCEPSMLFRGTGNDGAWEELAALRSIPSAPTWSFPPRPWTSHVRAIAPSPHDAGRLLVGIELGGLMLSEDGGRTWFDHRPGAQRDVHALAWHPTASGRAYEAGGGGAAWSLDGGSTWRAADEGRDRHYTWALAVDPVDPDCWYVSASPGPMQAHRGRANAHVYRWRGGGPWERVGSGLPEPLDAMPYALAIADGSLHAGLSDGRIFASGDGGESWRELQLRGEGLTQVVALAVGTP
jgi:photosystem II stability/assembly factor-like uncharacterized protein